MRDAFVKTLLEAAKTNSEIVLITGDLGFGVLDEFQRELPNQFINSGINEQTMMSLAAGYASTGKIVFVYSIANFPTLRCLEQIRNDVCLMDNPVTIVSVGSGYSYGSHGYSHHALEDIAVMRAMPNMEIFSPADPFEAEEITKIIIQLRRPSFLRLGKSNEPAIHLTKPALIFGNAAELSEGKCGTLIFTGSVGSIAKNAAQILENQGFPVSVASMPFISNIDLAYLEQAVSKGPIITIEEHSYRGGFGSAILEFINKNNLKARIALVAADQKDLSQIGDQDFLRSQNGISEAAVVNKFLSLIAN